MGTQTPSERELAELVVGSLNLENIKPEDVDPDAALFGGDLGLDSIDALEIVLELQRSFGVEIADEEVGRQVLRNVSTIVKFIETTRETAG